jgi:hypothetical protein
MRSRPRTTLLTSPEMPRDLLPRIKAILDELHAADPPLWQAATVAEIGRRVEAWLRAHHPELSDEAITAVSNQFAFEWR